MDREAVFVDTWGWMVLGHRREPCHTEVKRIYQELRSNQIPLYTSDYVLDEIITLLFRREIFEEAMRFVEGILGAAVLGQLMRLYRKPSVFSKWSRRRSSVPGLQSPVSGPSNTIWALKDVSFEVKRDEVLGVSDAVRGRWRLEWR